MDVLRKYFCLALFGISLRSSEYCSGKFQFRNYFLIEERTSLSGPNKIASLCLHFGDKYHSYEVCLVCLLVSFVRKSRRGNLFIFGQKCLIAFAQPFPTPSRFPSAHFALQCLLYSFLRSNIPLHCSVYERQRKVFSAPFRAFLTSGRWVRSEVIFSHPPSLFCSLFAAL